MSLSRIPRCAAVGAFHEAASDPSHQWAGIAKASWIAQPHQREQSSFTVDMGTEKCLGLVPKNHQVLEVGTTAHRVRGRRWRQFLHDGSDGNRATADVPPEFSENLFVRAVVIQESCT